MAFHHVAIATRDLEATHRFYTEIMGFELVKTVVAPTESGGGWAKHVFYDTGGDGLIAFWDLHDDTLPDFDPAISTALGLPAWVNHIAFRASLDEIDERIARWNEFDIDVVEVDHGFCRSVYALDPNRILVEWCADTRPLNETDRREAHAAVHDPAPELETPPRPVFHLARDARVGDPAGAAT
jgi:catechol 2,3-dioxygenase-like lactoylglutathione lyase family enzyme